MKNEALITAALKQIVFEGWGIAAFDKAEQAQGWKKGTYAAYFPGGMQDFVRAFHRWVDGKMLRQLEAQSDFADAKVREKIHRCVMARLAVLTPYREAVRRLVHHQLLPWNKPLALASVAGAADAMWKAAGDRSTDYNFYTKRALLAGVYAATLNYWLRDESDDFSQTADFLRRRIDNVLKFGQMVDGLKQRFGKKAA